MNLAERISVLTRHDSNRKTRPVVAQRASVAAPGRVLSAAEPPVMIRSTVLKPQVFCFQTPGTTGKLSGDSSGPTRRAQRTVCGVSGFAAFALIALLIAGSAWAGPDAPYVPVGDNVILQHVPPTTDPRVRHFDKLRATLRQQPGNVDTAVKLARAYINYGRSTGDARFLGRALAVIEPWMKKRRPPVSVAMIHATIQQSRHFFKASREELNQIIERDPANLQAWLTLATVAMVQGDMKTANHACVHVASTGGDFMGTVCTASLRSLTGHNRQALALLNLVKDPGPKAPPAIRAWVDGLMADVAMRMGNNTLADSYFKQALQWTPGDNFLLADYGDFLLDQGRAKRAADLVKPYTQSDTSLLRLVLAEQALGSANARTDAVQMQARFHAMDERGSHVYRREQAGFVLHVLHDPQRALKLAQQNWTVQRAPKDVRVYLAAALAAGKPKAAKPVLDFLSRTGLKDVRLDPLLAKFNDIAARQSAAATQRDAP